MKRIIKLTEEQLRNIVSKVIKEQSTSTTNSDFINNLINAANSGSNKAMDPKGGVNQFTGQKSLNIGCVGLKSPETYKVIKGINGEEFTFYNNGRFKDISDESMGFYVCGAQANIVNLMYDDNPKAIKYFNMTPTPVANSNVNCAPQLVDISKGKILKFGCKTQGVKELQNLLDVTPITGYFGNKTLVAVKSLQTSKNIKSDGIVGIETYPYILALGQTNTPPPVQDVSEDDDIAMLDNLFKKD